ncbi:MAG: type III pantothenate kinase [Clostridia bacterium]
MILTVDIGNSNIVIGIFENDSLKVVFRLSTDLKATFNDYLLKISAFLEQKSIKSSDIKDCIISSVVPPLHDVMDDTFYNLIKKSPIFLNQNLKFGISISKYKSNLGFDRIADTVGALQKYTPALAVFDFGTATTLSVIDENREFIGGMIMPGVGLSLNALSENAANLPKISIEKPLEFLGTDTISSMQSGFSYGFAAMLDGVINKLYEKVSPDIKVIVTGGYSRFVTPYSVHKLNIEENLLLEGIYQIYLQNF